MRATIQELARNVDRAQAELDRAKEALLAALSGTTINRRNVAIGRPPSTGRPQRGPGSDSVAARVLSLVQSAGAAGISRANIIMQLGPENTPAITAALKKHAQMKRMATIDGTWRVVEATSPKQKAPKAKKTEGASK